MIEIKEINISAITNSVTIHDGDKAVQLNIEDNTCVVFPFAFNKKTRHYNRILKAYSDIHVNFNEQREIVINYIKENIKGLKETERSEKKVVYSNNINMFENGYISIKINKNIIEGCFIVANINDIEYTLHVHENDFDNLFEEVKNMLGIEKITGVEMSIRNSNIEFLDDNLKVTLYENKTVIEKDGKRKIYNRQFKKYNTLWTNFKEKQKDYINIINDTIKSNIDTLKIENKGSYMHLKNDINMFENGRIFISISKSLWEDNTIIVSKYIKIDNVNYSYEISVNSDDISDVLKIVIEKNKEIKNDENSVKAIRIEDKLSGGIFEYRNNDGLIITRKLLKNIQQRTNNVNYNMLITALKSAIEEGASITFKNYIITIDRELDSVTKYGRGCYCRDSEKLYILKDNKLEYICNIKNDKYDILSSAIIEKLKMYNVDSYTFIKSDEVY